MDLPKIEEQSQMDANLTSDVSTVDTPFVDQEGLGKMDAIETGLDGEFSFVWFNPSEITIEVNSESNTPISNQTENVGSQTCVIKAETDESEYKDNIKELNEQSQFENEFFSNVHEISELKSEIELKDEIKIEDTSESSEKLNQDDMLVVSEVENVELCNPNNELYHYCTKCSFKCILPDCGFITKSKSAFETHQKVVVHQHVPKQRKKILLPDHTKPDVLQCTYCSFITKKMYKLKSHIEDCLKNITRKAQDISNCQECGFILNKNVKSCKKCGWRMGDYISVVPQKSKNVELTQESATKNSKRIAKNDTTKKPNNFEKRGSADTISCEFCNFKTSQKSVLAIHVLKNCKGVQELANNNSEKSLPQSQEIPAEIQESTRKRRRSSSSESSVLEPDSTTSKNDILLKCSFCTFTTAYPDSLILHTSNYCSKNKSLPQSKVGSKESLSLPPDLWKCEFCSYDTSRKTTLAEHMKHECPNFVKICCNKLRIAQCNKCSFVTKLRCDLVTHLINGRCSDNPEKRCNYCNFVTRREEELVVHMMKNCNLFLKKCENVSSSKDKDCPTDVLDCDSLPISTCANCGFASKKEALEIHKRRCALRNSIPKIIKCKFCNYTNTRTETVIQHSINECKKTRSVAQRYKISRQYLEKNKLQCMVYRCPFIGKTNLELSNHMGCTTHTFECQYCPFSTTAAWPYKAHVWKHEHDGLCKFCGIKLKTMNEYNNHMTNHSSVFQCTWCPVKTGNKDALAAHERKCKFREGERCQQCNFTTTINQFLNIHKRHCKTVNFDTEPEYKDIIADIKFSCNLCGYKDNRKSVFVEHYILKHNVFQCIIYKCKECIFKTQEFKMVRKHYFEEHPQVSIAFQCPICFQSEKELVDYRWHYMQHFTL